MQQFEGTKAQSCESVEALAREKTLGREREDEGSRRCKSSRACMNKSADAQKCEGIVCEDLGGPKARGRLGGEMRTEGVEVRDREDIQSCESGGVEAQKCK